MSSDTPIEFIAKNLASGAINYVGGAACGAIFNSILGGGEEKYPGIEELSKNLDGINRNINNLDKDIQELSNRISNQLKEIHQEELYLAWENVTTEISEYKSQISTQYNRYIEYAKYSSTTSEESILQLVENILDTNTGAEVSLNSISRLFLGERDEKGALQLWQEMMMPLVLDGVIDWEETLSALFDYYQSILVVQLQAANLLVEGFNQRQNNPLALEKMRDYIAIVNSQEIPYLTVQESLIIASEPNSVFEDREGRFLKKIGYYKGHQASCPGHYSSFYRPYIFREESERLFASASALVDNKSRIVVTLLYPAIYEYYDNKTIAVEKMNDVELELVRISNKPEAFKAVSRTRVDFPKGTWLSNNSNFGHKFKRFVFEDLPDGQYALKDMNGIDGMNPIQARFEVLEFIEKAFLNYKMDINSGKYFGFMDFSGYLGGAWEAAS